MPPKEPKGPPIDPDPPVPGLPAAPGPPVRPPRPVDHRPKWQREADVGAPPGKVRRAARELGLDRRQARLAAKRPEDVARWAELGAIPPEEDPRQNA